MVMFDERMTKYYKCNGYDINVSGPVYNNNRIKFDNKFEGIKYHIQIEKALTAEQKQEMLNNPFTELASRSQVMISFENFFKEKENCKKGQLVVSMKKNMTIDSMKELITELEPVEEYIHDNYDEMIQFDYYLDLKDSQVKELTEEIREKLSL